MLIATDRREPRTRYKKSIKAVAQTKSLLKPGSSNKKIGGHVSKGRWRGMPIVSLTLEERATCILSCEQWNNCYGDNMPFAHRIDHTDVTFMPVLDLELAGYNARYVTGYLVRLHILGDFFSEEYAEFWRLALLKYPALHIWGYTHVPTDDPIGKIVFAMNGDRCVIRSSDRPDLANSAQVFGEGYGQGDYDIACPQQTQATATCGTCALCWDSNKRIGFSEH